MPRRKAGIGKIPAFALSLAVPLAQPKNSSQISSSGIVGVSYLTKRSISVLFMLLPPCFKSIGAC